MSATRPTSPASPGSSGASRREAAAPPRSAASRPPASRPNTARPSGARPPSARPPAARPRPKRRPGGFLRFLQVLLSIIVLIAVPLLAMVLAYSYGTGEPFREAATHLADDLAELFRSRLA